ncbi:hypothetical protein C9374_003952 [Naegleria lovaniensis]|uniref:receptor protein-tyrosine kinase n=1 Tax=Naegleria lovaniensis TaxID=51637 RepID=A0AA88H027_NAELO|nr:uncharacterized protein C9374_003952 [Naegleria lovaniensis]KAG2394188.1 hypothetical protein C9374_003952 [Naegleria lovaniensis]
MRCEIVCSVCSQLGDHELATQQCSSCQNSFCDFHGKKHLERYPQHDLTSMYGACVENLSHVCPYHLIPANTYCRTCEALICSSCGLSQAHKGHSCELIEEVVEQERWCLKQQVTLLAKNISQWVQEHSCDEVILNYELFEIEKKEKASREQVKSFCDNAKRMIDQRGQELEERINELCQEGTDALRSILGLKEAQADLKRTFEDMESLGSFALLEAKTTKFVQVERQFNKLKNNYSGHFEKLHQVQVEGLEEGLQELQKKLSSIGNVKAHNFSVTFSNLGAEGATGPTNIGTHYSDQLFLHGKVTHRDGIQQWKVPFDGDFVITAAGAAGGSNPYKTSIRAGYGAEVRGVFHLTKETILSILVGQKGGDAKGSVYGGAGGGGGGTFVVQSPTNTPLLVASGGNGCNYGNWKTNGPGGRGPMTNENYSVEKPSQSDRGGGGGGFTCSGKNGQFNTQGGCSFLKGGKGGTHSHFHYGADGGFRGGGSALHEGGGGGGYVGGSVVTQNLCDAVFPTNGAVSYNSGTNQQAREDYNSGHGYVIITSEQLG